MRLNDGDYWIDDYGSWNHVAFGQLCPFSSDSVVRNRQGLDFAFRRLGMVRVSKRPGTITIQWDIASVSDESLDAAVSQLWDLEEVERTKLRYYFGGWTFEVFEGVRQACLRLDALRSYRDVVPFPGVRTRPITFEDRANGATPLIGRVRHLLDRNRNRLDNELWQQLREANANERILLFQEEDSGAWLSYNFIGRNSLFSQVFGTSAIDDLMGRHCAVDPSQNRIGYSASRSYTQVVASEGEQYDQVFMPVKHDDDDGIWVSYQRMLVTCRNEVGRKMLLLLTDYTEERLIAA